MLLVDIILFIINYVERLFFVFTVYCLLIVYGMFSDKTKKIIPKKYKDGEIFVGNLVHKFNNLKDLNDSHHMHNTVVFHYVTNIQNVTNIQTAQTSPVFVFLHGIFESWYSWHNQLEELDKMGVLCIAIDLKNHGNTSAHYAGSVENALDMGKNFDLTHQGVEIAELLSKLCINNVVWVTTDLGTLVCDKLINKIYCPKTVGWIRCHEPMPAYPNDKGLPQKYLFWFNINLSLFLMHYSNEMILKLFYRATGWKSCESFSATNIKINDEEIKQCLANSICLYTSGKYKGHNSNYMSWAGAYAYAFLNDIYTGAILNIKAYEDCNFPVWIVTGEFDKSCLLEYVDGTKSLGCKFVNDQFCTKMIEHNGQDQYVFFLNNNCKPSKAFVACDYFQKSLNVKLVIHTDAGHMSHLETPDKFTNTLKDFFQCISNVDDLEQ